MKNAFIIVLAVSANTLWSQEKGLQPIDSLYVDFSIPDVSAFTMLGISPQSVTKPGNVKELTLAILNVVNTGKSISPGLAVEWSPYLTFGKSALAGFRDYHKSQLIRNLQLTFGTLGDTAGTNVGIGLKWTIVDKTDPLMDENFQNRIEKQQRQLNENDPKNASVREKFNNGILRNFTERIDTVFRLRGGTAHDSIADLFSLTNVDDLYVVPQFELLQNECKTILNRITSNGFANARKDLTTMLDNLIVEYLSIEQRYLQFKRAYPDDIENLKESFKRGNWNKLVSQVGLGHVLSSADNTWGRLKNTKLSSFGSLAIPLSSTADSSLGLQLIVLAKYDDYYERDSAGISSAFNVGARSILGSNDFRLSFEGLYSNFRKSNSATDERLRLTVGVEFKFLEGTWLELGVGSDGPLAQLKQSKFTSNFNFKYCLNKTRRFGL